MKTFKKLLSLLLAGVMTLSLLAAVPFTAVAAEGDIDWTASTITLDSAEDLLAFATYANADATNNRFSGKTVLLGSDIDMSGKTWTPISTQFRGTFDGQGYAIKNLKITGTGDIAMFKLLVNAKIKNVQFVNVSVTNSTVYSSGSLYAMTAAIAANATGTTTIENVYVSGSVTGVRHKSAYKTGVFVAQTYNAILTLNSCVSDCNLSGGKAVGGFVGTSTKGANVIMNDCVFSGSITGLLAETGTWVGRLSGNGEFNRCLVIGQIAYNEYSGVLFYADTNSFAVQDDLDRTSPFTIALTDCYVAIDDAWANLIVGGHGTRNTFKMTISYTDEDSVSYSTDTTINHAAASQAVKKFDSAFADMRNNYSTLYPGLKGKIVPANNQAVTYATGKQVPRFIPKTVYQMLVDVDFSGVQFSKVNQTAKTYDIRFVGALNTNHLNYAEQVGFTVTAIYTENGEQKSMDYTCEGNLIYTSIVETVGTTLKSITAESLGADYLFALAITDIPTTVGEITFNVQPYVVADGLTPNVESDPISLTVTYSETDGLVADYSVID